MAGLGWSQEPRTSPGSPTWVVRAQALNYSNVAFADTLSVSWIRKRAVELGPAL